MPTYVHYLPIITTLIALPFSAIVLRRWSVRKGSHHLWWGIGLLAYGAGTALEAATTLWGWHEPIFKAWYVTGALLGGAPLAQGTVYLLMEKKLADRLATLLVAVILVATIFVILTPIDMALVESYRLTGKVMAWTWVRAFSPFVNLYAFVFLVGGALISARRYAKLAGQRHRFAGNLLIAVGGLLPGIGGSATRFGHTEVLYVTELVGLSLILTGYFVVTRSDVPMDLGGTVVRNSEL